MHIRSGKERSKKSKNDAELGPLDAEDSAPLCDMEGCSALADVYLPVSVDVGETVIFNLCSPHWKEMDEKGGQFNLVDDRTGERYQVTFSPPPKPLTEWPPVGSPPTDIVQ